MTLILVFTIPVIINIIIGIVISVMVAVMVAVIAVIFPDALRAGVAVSMTSLVILAFILKAVSMARISVCWSLLVGSLKAQC